MFSFPFQLLRYNSYVISITLTGFISSPIQYNNIHFLKKENIEITTLLQCYK